MGFSEPECIIKQNQRVRKGGLDLPEQEIVALLRERDQRGAEALLAHYGALMRYIISPILPNRQDAEECLSETAMRVWEKIGLYDPERGSWRAWLTALTRNTALNFARKSSGAAGSGELHPGIPSSEPTPEEELMRRERAGAASKALSRLPDSERLIFYRKYYYLQSTAQIAAELGMTERAVEGRLYRLKKKLRGMLGGEINE